MLPMLREQISGEKRTAARSRSSTVIVGLPPVVMFITTSDCRLIALSNDANTSGLPVGSPVSGTRACRWTTAAPATAAAIDCSAICSGVIGRASDMVGVWMAPVTAHVIIALLLMSAYLD